MMVRILSDGEIVQDDDPRAKAVKRGKPPTQEAQSSSSQHQPQYNDAARQHVNAGGGDGTTTDRAPSFMDAANYQLTSWGVPTITLGDIRIPPAIAVGIMLAMLLFGWNGLIVIAVMFFVHQFSRPDSMIGQRIANSVFLRNQGQQPQQGQVSGHQQPRPDQASSSSAKKRGAFGGHGYRLGD